MSEYKKLFNWESENYMEVVQYLRKQKTPFHDDMAECIMYLIKTKYDAIAYGHSIEMKLDYIKEVIEKPVKSYS